MLKFDIQRFQTQPTVAGSGADGSAKTEGTYNIFQNTLNPNSVTQFTLFRGVTDYTQLAQFDLYETGYSFLILLDIPKFITRLTAVADAYELLIDNYRHILEWEFRGAQGIEDITTDTSPISNGITDLNIITRVNEQGGSSFTMNYFERSGSIITKVHELYLRGIKDPKTQIKRYNGLLTESFTKGSIGKAADKPEGSARNRMQDAGYQYEVFHFLLIVTDNTALNVEKAYILASCQPSTANTSIYNVTRGEIQFQEMALQFNGIPLPGRIVNKRAAEFLDYINKRTCFDEMQFGYNILSTSEYQTENENSDQTYVSSIEGKNGGTVQYMTTDQVESGESKNWTEQDIPAIYGITTDVGVDNNSGLIDQAATETETNTEG